MFGLFKPQTVAIQDAKILYSKGNFKKALSVCRSFLDLNKDDFDAMNLLGDIYYKSGDKTKSLEVFKELASSTEADKYLDRSIAVTKKIIRIFPEQYDLYRKLSKLFEKKGIIAEQLKVLYELANIYEQKGLTDKVIDILKEVAEIDRSNIENYKTIITKLNKYGKTYDVCKFMYYCLELCNKNNDYNSLKFFTEIAITNKCDLTDSIFLAIKYFENHPEHNELFKKFSETFFKKNYNKELFETYAKIFNYSENKSFYNNIIDLYKKCEVFDYVLGNTLETDYQEFKRIFNAIKDLPDYDFHHDFGNIVGKYCTKVEDIDLLETMLVIATRSESEKNKLSIYEQMIKIYEAQGLTEKVIRIKNILDDASFNVVKTADIEEKTGKNINVESYFETAESKDEFVLDLGNDDLKMSEIELDLTSFEPSYKDSKENTVADQSLVSDKDTSSDFNMVEPSDKSTENRYGEINMDIDLGAFDVSEEIAVAEPEQTSVVKPEKISADLPQFESLEDKIAKIKNMMVNNNLSEAQRQLDELLLDFPDEEKVKDLASEIIFYEDENIQEAGLVSKTEVEDIRSDFQKVASAIRQSINQVVSPDDYETHYDLAIAYMEMELFDDAIEELKKSATGEKKYESLFLMGECYKRSGFFDDAINIHKLVIMDYDERDKLLNSLYEIGSLLEEKGEGASSKKYFEKVYNLDSNFRDIKTRFKNPTSPKINFIDSSPKIEVEKTKKKKVSFL